MKPIYGSDGQRVFAFRKGPPKARGSNDNPEHRFQMDVKRYLDLVLPPSFLWTANAAGVRVVMTVAVQMKAAGVKRGWPDIMILGPGGGIKFLELKSSDGALRPEQKAFRDHCERSGQDMWACCRTLDEVREALARWKVPVRG